MKLLLTGGAGYIGSHTAVVALRAGHEVTLFDNWSNAKPVVVERIAELSGRRPDVVTGDVRDRARLDDLFASRSFDAVVHFAALKAVGESVAQPVRYYENNVSGTLTLVQAMEAAGVRSIVFSSSATVYGDPATVPITEEAPRSATNPYGWSKLMIEQVLMDLQLADPRWSVTLLRYFNPVGAHPSGRIGEDPQGIPNNLTPYITQVAVGRRDALGVFGNDYPTPDGTGLRDYIHVMDLAEGHLAALEKRASLAGCHIYNLGTGEPASVLEVLRAFEQACGKTIPYRIAPRRAGDIAACYADSTKAERELGWRTTRNLAAMAEDAWRWQSQNPAGYVADDLDDNK